MAFNTQKARDAGYSDAEIADYLGKDSGFDTAKARQAGYSDSELVTHLTGLKAKAAEEPSILDRVKSGLSVLSESPLGIAGPAGIVKAVGSKLLGNEDDGMVDYKSTTADNASPKLKAAVDRASKDKLYTADNPRPETLSAPSKKEATLSNVATGIAEAIPQGIETTKQGIRSQYGDLIGSEALAKDAQLKASRNRNAIQDNTPAIESRLGQAAYGGATSTMQQLPGMTAAIATGTAAPALLYGSLATQTEAYTRYRDRGASKGEALLGSGLEGATEYLTEKMPMKVLVDKFGKVGAGKFLSEYMGKEVGSELVATHVQDAIDTAIANPNKTWGQYLAERPDAAFDTLVATVVQGGAVSGASKAMFELQGGAWGQAKRSINELTSTDQHVNLSDENLAKLHEDATKLDAAEPGSVSVSAIEAEMQRRASLGTLERASETAQREQHPLNVDLSGQASAPEGTLANAAASVPPGAAAAPAETEVLQPHDVKAEHLPAMDPEARNHWATNVPADQVTSTLSGIKDPQARADMVDSLGLSDRASAKLHSDLAGNTSKAEDFQTLHAQDQDLLNSVNAHLGETQNEQGQTDTQTSMPDLGTGQSYGQYIAGVNARLAEHASAIEAQTGQAAFHVNPVSQETGRSFAPLSEAINKVFGTDVIPFSSPDAHAPDGFAWSGVAHVNVDNLQRPAAWAVGHEFGHTMEQSKSEGDRETADWLRENLVPMISKEGQRKYAEQFLFKATQDRPGLTLAQVNADPALKRSLHSEMVQDFLGKRMTDREFLDSLAKKDPVGFGSFVKKWIKALDKMIAALHGQAHADAVDLDEHIKDLAKAKNLAQTAMIRWRKAAMERQAETKKAEAKAKQAAKTTDTRTDAKQTVDPIGPVEPANAPTDDPAFAKKDVEKFSVLKREKASGRYVGAPDWVGSSTAEVAKLFKKVKGMAIEGESGKLWYEKSSKAVLDLVGGDKAEAEKFVGLLAIYSQGTEVGVNTGFALEAYYQWKAGLPIKTGRFPTEQTKKANMWLKEGKDWGGIKTNNFYVDLMEEINPAHVDDSHATMDMWMALAYDYGMKVLDQGPKYAFAKTMTELIAKDLGWKPHQVQAAIWSSIKTRIEATEKERIAQERKTGIQTDNGDGTWSYAKGREYDHFRLAHALGMKLKITPEEIAAKGFNYEDALNQRMIQMSWEATPSVTAGTIPGIHSATLPQKMEYLEAVAKALTVDGKNLIAEAVGLHSPPTLFGISAWEGATGAGAQSFLPAPILGAKGKRAVLPVARNLLNDYSALMGLVLKQDAVVWHHAVYDESNARKNGMDLITNRALTEDEIKLLYLKVYDKFNTWEIAPGYTANGAKLLNFVEGLDNKAFQKGIEEIIEALPDTFGDGFVEHRGFRSDGEYVGNNWKDNANGEEYQARLRTRRPDLLERATDLRARVEAVDRKFNDKYNWGGPSFAKRQDGTGRDQGSADTTSGQREVAAGIVGRHYSSQQRQSLDGRYYGTGIKGAEGDRLSRAKDRRLKTRLYFYIDEGKGVKPEAGVGRFAHDVNLSNLYSTSTRTLSWEKDPYGDNAVTANNFETAVLNAGYSGYYRPGAFGDQGVAILLGDAAVGVKPVAAPSFAKKWTEVSQMVLINETAKNKKTWGKHIGEAQIKRVDQESDSGFKAANAGQKLNAAYLDAAKQKDTYDNYLKAVAEKFGLKDSVPGLKGRKRTVEKLIADYNSDVTKLKDMLRGTIETESLTQARDLYEALREVAPLADVKGNDKSFLDPSKPAASPAGYRDAKLILDIGGVPTELIIAPAALLRAKDIAHALYEDQRTLSATLNDDKLTQPQRDKIQDKIDVLDAKMAEIYAPAVERSQSSSASLRVHGTELSRELTELSGRLLGSNATRLPRDSSATAMPSKSKNLVPSGKSANGDLTVMGSTSNTDSIPQGKENVQFAKRFEPVQHEAFGPALAKAEAAAKKGDSQAMFNPIPVSLTPAALRQVKAMRSSSHIIGTGNTIYKKGTNTHTLSSHNAAIPMDVLRELPALLADPIAIYDKGAFDAANPKSGSKEAMLLVVLPVKVDGEYVTVAIAPGTQYGKGTVNFIKSVHTRAPKTLNQYVKYQVYEGITDRQEKAQLHREQFRAAGPHAVAQGTGDDVTIRPSKGIDKVKSRNDIPAMAKRSLNTTGVPEETTAEGIQRKAQDKFNRFKVLQNWLKTKGVQLTDAADVHLAETLTSGRTATRKEDFRDNVMGPLIQKTQKAGIDMSEVADYLKMQHAAEANAQARKNHGKADATAFGVTDAEAAQALADYATRPDHAKLKALANEWRGITNQTRDILLKGGIISQDMADAWNATYSMYVPVKGTDDEKAAQTGTGKGLNVNGKQKQRLGHGLRDEAIIENIIRDHEKAIALDEKNLVGKALIKFALEANNEDIITVSKPVLRQVLKQGQSAYMVSYHGSDVASFKTKPEAYAYIGQQLLKAGGKQTATQAGFKIDKTQDPVRVMLQASPMLADNEVNVYVAGHAIRVQINDEVAAREYTNMGVEHLNTILAGAREVNNWLSKVYTGYSPDFILTNPIRDAIQGAITLIGEHGGLTAAKIFANYPLALKELAKHYRKGGSSQIVSDYRNNGGSTGGAYLSDLERIGNDVQASYDEYNGALATYKSTYVKAIAAGKSPKAAAFVAAARAGIVKFKRLPVIGHFARLMEHMNALTENALRVATFHTLVQGGMTKPRAAAQAKNLMNFNRKGESANAIGALYLFYNPSVQGTTLIKQALINSPHKHQAQALTGMMVLGAMAIAALGMSGDDDDKRKWENTPDHVKDGNVVVNVGDKQLTLTLPYGYRMFWTLGNIIFDAMHGKDKTKLAIRMASSVFANISPFGNPFEGEHPILAMSPTLVRMATGPEVNENSFGSKIAPDKHNEALPDSQNMNRATNGTLYAGIADKMNSLTGGGKYESGAIDVSPEVLKFWVTGLTGGSGQFAMDMTNMAIQGAQGVGPQSVKDIPVVRRFVREPGVSDARQAYWERANEAKLAAGQIGLARKAADADGMGDLLDKKSTLFAMSKYAEGMLKVANAQREASDAVRQDKSLSLRDKVDQMKAIEKEETAVYSEFIDQFDTETGRK